MYLAHNIRYLRRKQGWSQEYLAERLGYKSYTTIQKWESGVSEPPLKTAHALAELFHVDVDALTKSALDPAEGDSNLRPMARKTQGNAVRIPVLGRVPAGTPIEAIEDIIDWEEIPEQMVSGGRTYFALQVSGDSMYPKYLDGDVIIVRQQSQCTSGNDCVVYVNGYDATLKTVKLNADGGLTLQPINPSYSPHTYTAEEVISLPVTVAGVVVELRRKVFQ